MPTINATDTPTTFAFSVNVTTEVLHIRAAEVDAGDILLFPAFLDAWKVDSFVVEDAKFTSATQVTIRSTFGTPLAIDRNRTVTVVRTTPGK